MRKITNTSATIALLALATLTFTGCTAGHRSAGSYRAHWGNEAAAALPAPGIYAPYRGNVGFEYSRRDGALSNRTPTPYSALGQWPGPLPPRERPVRFERWEQ